MYKILRQLIPEQEAHIMSEIIKKDPSTVGDQQVSNCYRYTNNRICNILLGELTSTVSEISGKTLKPTYAYCRMYLKGSEIKPHIDRASCEYSVTLNLSQTHPWPIYMENEEVLQNPGDAVFYKGNEIEHSRKVFEGDEYMQVFLHYIDIDGPYKECVYDETQFLEKNHVFCFGVRSTSNYINYYRFTRVIPELEIDILIKRFEHEKLEDARLGNGDINLEKRKTKIFWIPKNDEFKYLYEKVCRLISQCNSDFYQFKLSELSDNIQYSVYTLENSGFYGWHTDMGANCNRKLTCVIQLSDPSEYEGGELQINNGGIITLEKEKGTVIIFPSYLLHQVTPVTRGTRRSLVCWASGPNFV